MIVIIALCCLVCNVFVSGIVYGEGESVLLPPETSSAPVPDGKLEEKIWRDALELKISCPQLQNDAMDSGTAQTTIWLTVQEEVLHIAADCRFAGERNEWPGAERNRNTGRYDGFRTDKPPFENDHIELCFEHDDGLDSVKLYQVSVDLTGDRLLRCDGEIIEEKWPVKVRIEESRWFAEMSLPLKLVGEDGRGLFWRFNATRTLYGINGQLVQGLALDDSGYGRPIQLLLPGKVGGEILRGKALSSMQVMDGMRRYFTAKDQANYQSLADIGESDGKNVKMEPQAALPLIRKLSRTSEQIEHQIILNYMFEGQDSEVKP